VAIGYQYWYYNYYVLNGFLIQKTQNKDSKAIQIKLNELIAATKKPAIEL
jgi:low affinity Fe/Cu permease